MKKTLIWLLIISVLSITVCFVVDKEKFLKFVNGPELNFFKKEISESEEKISESIKESLSEKVSEIKTEAMETLKENLSGLLEKSGSTLSKSIESGKEKISESVKENFLSITQNIAGETLNTSENSNLYREYFSYLTKINQPISFIIRNPLGENNPEDLDYLIDWGDGLKEEGKLSGGENIIISHLWKKTSEYLVKLEVMSDGLKIFDYQIKVLVAE
ncbi:hypothetical protein JW698_03320 [Candidatus Wolfebacteria bacterium]|nr:hypothetical protein [Candidatus Wolfebacteria bacterium]